MVTEKNLRMAWLLYLCLVLTPACTSADGANSSNLKNPTSEESGSEGETSNDESEEGDSGTSAESSDEEGKSAIEAAMSGKEITKPRDDKKSQPPTTDNQYLTSFPKTGDQEELHLLLAENERLELESNKTCFNEISSITKNAKNSEALASASDQIKVLIKDNLSEYHWCFLANHHLLTVSLASEISMAEKIKYFQSSMISLVALAKGLDFVSNLDRYARYNRDRYITLSKEFFGRQLSPIDSPN